MFLAADAYPALIRALYDAERAGFDLPGFDLPRLPAGTVPRRGFGDSDDPSAVLTWRLRERLQDAAEAQQDAAEAQQDDRHRPLAALTAGPTAHPDEAHRRPPGGRPRGTQGGRRRLHPPARARHHAHRPHPSRPGPAPHG